MALIIITTTSFLLLCGLVQATHDIKLERTELEVRLPKAISDHTATLARDGTVDSGNELIYIAGGCDNPDGNIYAEDANLFICPSVSSSFYGFDPTTKEFIDLPDLPRQRYRHAAVAIQNHIFFVGGRNANDDLIKEVDVFDVTTRDWALEYLPEGYATSDLAGWGTETRAYFVGGYDANYTALGIVYSIDVAKYAETGEPEIEDHDNLSSPRGDIAATVNLDKGYAYVSGGFSHENDWCEPLDSVERYSLAGDTWISIAKLPTARADKAMVTLEGHTLSLGGEKQIENKCQLEEPPSPGELTVAVDDIEVLNDDDTTWQQLEPLPEHRFRFAAVVHDDTIYTFGGQQAYDESCKCLRAVDEVVAYVDVNAAADEDKEEQHDDADGHDHDEDGDEDGEDATSATLDGSEEEVATAGDEESAALSSTNHVLVSLMLVLFVAIC